MALRRAVAIPVVVVALALTASAQQQPPPAGERGRGRGADSFAGQPRINALIVSGGCCHDYPMQAKAVMDAIGRALPVDWTVVVQGGRGTTGTMPIYATVDWSRRFDIVIHNECLADVDSPEYIRRITTGHRNGPPALVVHCAMHSYRAAKIDDWREFLGVTSLRHTRPFPIPVKVVGKNHPAMKGFKEDWVTPVDELYVIDKVWPNTTPLLAAVSPEDGKEYPLAWTSDYHGARVFGTTIGHGNATFEDPVFLDLLTRGFTWALQRD